MQFGGFGGFGIEVPFSVDLTKLPTGLAQAEALISQASARIDTKMRSVAGGGTLGMHMDAALNERARAASAFSRAIEQRLSAEASSIRDYAEGLGEKTRTAFFGAGEQSGDAYARGMSSSIERKLAAGALKFAIVGVADQALRGLADAIKNASDWQDVGISIGERLLAGIKSVPIAGAFAEIGEAMSAAAIPDEVAESNSFSSWAAWIMYGVKPGSKPRSSLRGMPGDTGSTTTSDDLARDAERQRYYEEHARAMREAAAIDEAFNLKEQYDSEQQRQAKMADEESKREQARMLGFAISARQDKLSLIRDMMGNVGSTNAADFLNEGQTAIGGYRFAQANASQLVAENTKTLVGLTKDANRILDDIKRLEMERNDLR